MVRVAGMVFLALLPCLAAAEEESGGSMIGASLLLGAQGFTGAMERHLAAGPAGGAGFRGQILPRFSLHANLTWALVENRDVPAESARVLFTADTLGRLDVWTPGQGTFRAFVDAGLFLQKVNPNFKIAGATFRDPLFFGPVVGGGFEWYARPDFSLGITGHFRVHAVSQDVPEAAEGHGYGVTVSVSRHFYDPFF